jgi:hypothetical protein
MSEGVAEMAKRLPPGSRFTAVGSRGETIPYQITKTGEKE